MRSVDTQEPRTKTILKNTGAACLTTGAALVTVAQTLSEAVGPFGAHILVAGGALTGVGIVVSVLGYVWLRINTHLDYYRSRRLIPDELPQMQDVLERHGSQDVSTAAQKKELMGVNRDMFYAVEKIGPRNLQEIVGYHIIFPLRKVAVNELEGGKRTRWFGEQVSTEDLAKTRGRASALYIGFIWGAHRKAKAATIKLLMEDLAKRCKKHNTYKIFTRPMTNDALRLVKRYHFKQAINGAIPELQRVCYKIWDPIEL